VTDQRAEDNTRRFEDVDAPFPDAEVRKKKRGSQQTTTHIHTKKRKRKGKRTYDRDATVDQVYCVPLRRLVGLQKSGRVLSVSREHFMVVRAMNAIVKSRRILLLFSQTAYALVHKTTTESVNELKIKNKLALNSAVQLDC